MKQIVVKFGFQNVVHKRQLVVYMMMKTIVASMLNVETLKMKHFVIHFIFVHIQMVNVEIQIVANLMKLLVMPSQYVFSLMILVHS